VSDQAQSDTPNAFGREDVTVVERIAQYDGFFQFVSLKLRHRLFAGGWSETFERELFERGNAAAVLLYDAKADKVAFVEQIRIGAVAATLPDGTKPNPWLLEVVAGMIEDGESAESVVRRESIEEAGCELQQLEHIAGYYPSPGACSEYIELFCGAMDSDLLGGLHGLSDEQEDIRLQIVDREQAWRWMGEGKLNNASTIIAMQWLQLHARRLQQQWC